MLVVGLLLLPLFFVYESKFSKSPAVPFRFVLNKGVAAASWINFFDNVRQLIRVTR